MPLPRSTPIAQRNRKESESASYGFNTPGFRISCSSAYEFTLLMGTPPIALLVRHAHTLATDLRLTGRTPNIHLSERGHNELRRLRDQLNEVALDAVYSSPMVRALDTAAPMAADHGVAVDIEEHLNEMNCGEWTDKSFVSLASDPRWQAFNMKRSTALVPSGERAIDVQRRVVTLLARLAHRHRKGAIALVTHAEVIRCALLWFAGRSLDDFHQLTIDTASVTGILMSATPRILFVNATHATEVVGIPFLAPRT